jgi:hypothetical protein
MKNAWKGLVVGALTGMLGGAAMDGAAAGRRKAAAVADTLVKKAGATVDAVPSAAKATTAKVVDRIHDADIGDKVHHAASRINATEIGDKVADLLGTS